MDSALILQKSGKSVSTDYGLCAEKFQICWKIWMPLASLAYGSYPVEDWSSSLNGASASDTMKLDRVDKSSFGRFLLAVSLLRLRGKGIRPEEKDGY